MDGGRRGPKVASPDVSSDVSDVTIAQKLENVKGVQMILKGRREIFTDAAEITKDNISECSYTNGEHSNKNVPVYAIGYGTEKLGVEQDNTDIAKFVFELLGD